MSNGVFVFIEQRDGEVQKVGLELLGKASELAKDLNQQVTAVLLGKDIKSKAESLIQHGAHRVIVVEDDLLKEYLTEPYAKCVSDIIHKYDPEIVLFGATSIGRDLAPRLAARVHTGLTADCTSLTIDEESKNLMMTRPAFGGNLMATIVCEDFRPQMATVRPGVMQACEKDTSATGKVVEEAIDLSGISDGIIIREVTKSESKKKDITEANILVSGGRGIGGPEGFDSLAELAAELDAEISSSRATVDAGWIEKDRQVGQTGKTVRPEVYFAVGISGAIQHIAGMEESDLIIAINNNENAAIFNVADLGVVGDLNAIVPKLADRIRKEKLLKEEM